MSLVVPSHTYVHSIPIQRRIREIMNDKGGAFTRQALSARLGINRETFRKMLTGEREIYTFELEKIAKEMSLTVARILQEDIQALVKELDELLASSFDIEHGLQVANKLLSLSIGVTERCEAHVYMGNVLFQSRKYELAQQHRLEAHNLAKTLKETHGESIPYERTLRDLMTSFAVRKDYTNAYAMIELAKDVMDDDPKRLGGFHYTLAMIAYDSNRLEEASDQLYNSLHYFSKTGDAREIGKALHNVAFIEYKLKQYETAQELFEKAIPMLDSFAELRLYPIKDFVKVLHAKGQKEQAIELIEQAVRQNPSPSLQAKLLLLHSIYVDSPESAVQVLENDQVEDKYKIIACRALMDYHKRQGDSDSLMKYYVIADGLTVSDTNRYGEEDL